MRQQSYRRVQLQGRDNFSTTFDRQLSHTPLGLERETKSVQSVQSMTPMQSMQSMHSMQAMQSMQSMQQLHKPRRKSSTELYNTPTISYGPCVLLAILTNFLQRSHIQTVICTVFVVVALGSRAVTDAYPTGSGSCISGVPAVTGSDHLNPLMHTNISGATLNAAGIEVRLTPLGDSTTLQTLTLLPDEIVEVATGIEYTLAVVSTWKEYKGCMIRMQSIRSENASTTSVDSPIDMSAALLPGINTRSASDVCGTDGSVVGITHNSSDFKTQHTGTVRMDVPSKVFFDITVVGRNDDVASLYAYNNYTVSFRAPDVTSPTAAPVQPPTPLSTATPVLPPTASTPVSVASVVPSSAKPVLLTSAPVDATSTPPNIDLTYTKVVTDTISSIAVTYNNVDALKLSELRNVGVITEKWFLNFFNERSSQSNTTTSAEAKSSESANRRIQHLSHRYLETSTGPPPQAFIVQGSMETLITVLGQNVSAATAGVALSNTVTYSQQLSYRLHTEDSPHLPASMRGNNYQPLTPSQYSVLPYRSTSANSDLLMALTAQLSTAFETVKNPISIPIASDDKGEEPSTPPPAVANPDSGALGQGAIAGLIIGGIGVVVLIILVFVLLRRSDSVDKKYQMNDKNFASPSYSAGSADGGNVSDTGRVLQPNRGMGVNNSAGGMRMNSVPEEDHSSYDVESQFTSGVASSFGGAYGNDHGNTKDTSQMGVSHNRMNGYSGSDSKAHATVVTGSSSVVSGGTASVVTNIQEYVVYAPKGKLGIVVDNPEDDSGPIIYAIKETSPLLDSQLNVGDRLVMVDEVDVTKMPPALISKLISKRSGNPMRKLTLHRSTDNPAERLAV